jgi:HAD superfamily hydrolase (TIGR01549 family)
MPNKKVSDKPLKKKGEKSKDTVAPAKDLKYKYLFLDLDDTVFNSSSLYNEAIRMAWHHFRKFYDVQYEEFRDLFLKTRKELKKDFYRQSISHNRAVLFMRMLEKMEIEFDAEFVRELYETYWATVNASIQLFPGVRKTLNKVNEAGIVTLALSDGSLLSRLEKIEAVKLSKYFKFLVSSEEVVKTKPEKDAFELALKKTGANKEEVLFVGNSFSSDIVGGENYGIDTVWFNIEGKRKPRNAKVEPDYRIKRFDELLDILGLREAEK